MPSSPPKRPETCSPLPCGSPPITPAPTWARSCYRRSTRPLPARSRMRSLRLVPAVLALALACAPKQPAPEPEPQPASEPPLPKPNIDPGRVPAERVQLPAPSPYDTLQPVVPPETAYGHGWMPLASTGVDEFLEQHPTFDGRGVLIGILDTGIDPLIPGLTQTTTDAAKVVDL